ncbi:hypothetical protein SEA_IBANTIK_52 [Streptomyces phage Ibantik]|uniref:Uncharacterized protein n=1 Tax=Streptomyces phage Ibantik TaxID=2182397 RepID=A0A2U8UPD2_9CAUD|nr:hypothetical protein QEH36_gp052 [Streptomyces phage Ibantik]AWN05276.1 hypothetical protein SEA_IBANTIK_52 [Streptomyces phage Ibantik]
MSARDKLIDLFDAGGPHHLFSSEEVADSILALHAHELAEMQRVERDNQYGPLEFKAEKVAINRVIDLIDPEVEK